MNLRLTRWGLSAAMLVLGVAVGFGIPGFAYAQGSGGSGKVNSYTLSKSTYTQIERAQKLMMGKNKNKNNNEYKEAITILEDVLPRAKRESKFAHALVIQLIAQNYLLEKNYGAAIPYLATIVKLNALQPQSQESVIYQLATLYLGKSRYDDAIHLYRRVIASKEKSKQPVKPDLWYRLGLAYSFKHDYPSADRYIARAIRKAKTPHKDWYQNWFVVVYKLKNFKKANLVAKKLVSHWPKDRNFWSYFANTYLLLNEDGRAASVYGLMYKQGMLKNKDDYMQLVSLYLESKAPYKAAKIVESGLKKGIIPKTPANYETLAQAWIASRAWDRALQALGREAALSNSGKTYLRMASIYLNQRDYPQTIGAARNALRKGDLKQPGRAWMVLGEAAFAQKNWNLALKAFRTAAQSKTLHKDALGWIQYVKGSRGGR